MHVVVEVGYVQTATTIRGKATTVLAVAVAVAAAAGRSGR